MGVWVQSKSETFEENGDDSSSGEYLDMLTFEEDNLLNEDDEV